MAHNPKVLEGFLAFWTALDQCGLSHEDREVICMEMAVRNGCHYCVPAHLNMSEARGVDMEMITRIASGERLQGDSRAAKLQHLVQRLADTGGQLSDAELAQALEDGFDHSQLVAIVAEIAHCHFTNSFNRLAQTAPDPHFPPFPNG
ncbi:carboxymuconolactone decarboxylase family protein [Ruegeria sp.]|uniref:carboxymuconolactone decarboxylase family protein n=1 Tax=Ruegeria sp. TaxID=1879320 RepID=UPI00230C4DDE|nr:carboxymuconolactone decarboxylase family protein [Ruegeria sp.]MDA7963410.1 carboxymuconolactone decarboxylase family protein [Ruegeria sp.]